MKSNVKNQSIYSHVLELASDKAYQLLDSKELEFYDWIDKITKYVGCLHNLDTWELKNIDIAKSWESLDLPIPFQNHFLYIAQNKFNKFITFDFVAIYDKLFDYFITELKDRDYNAVFNDHTGNYYVDGVEIDII